MKIQGILTQDDWLRIAKEYSSVGPQALATELGVSKQRIQQIATKLRKNGIPIATLRSNNSPTRTFIAFVKENLPA